MTKLFHTLLLLVLMLAAALPAAAQYGQDDVEVAECIHIEATLGATGEYIFVFFYQDEFNNLLYNGIVKEFSIQIGTPGTVLEYNIIVPPQTLLLVATPGGVVQAAMSEEGEFVSFTFGDISLGRGRMDVDCMGAATDGRLNRFDQHLLAVIYPDGSSGYAIYAIDPATSQGVFDYNVTRSQVDAALAAANASGQPQAIVSGTTSSFYALGNGECQLNSPSADGKVETFVFNCSA